jgi:hypothetical protein
VFFSRFILLEGIDLPSFSRSWAWRSEEFGFSHNGWGLVAEVISLLALVLVLLLLFSALLSIPMRRL